MLGVRRVPAHLGKEVEISMQEGVCVSTGTDVRGSAINPPCKGSARALLTNE